MKSKLRRPFASKVQVVLIILLILSFILIAQQFDIVIFKIGLVLLITTTFVQIIFGNISPDTLFKRSMKIFCKLLLIIIIIFVIGIIIVPYLVKIGG